MRVRRTFGFGLLLAAAAALAATSAYAQDGRDTSGAPDVDQANAAQVDQIDGTPQARAAPLASAPSPHPDAAPVAQLGSAGARADVPAQLDSTRAPETETLGQLTTEHKSAAGGAQLYHDGPTAQPPAPLSTPAQGKPGGTVRLAGKDRCDPRTGVDAGKPACANVIESRADEFHRPQPPMLTAEQRLLIYERTGEEAPSLRMLVRQVGRNDVDADAPETQGLASVALAPPAAPAKPDKPSDPDAANAVPGQDTGAVVQAIIDTMNTTPAH